MKRNENNQVSIKGQVHGEFVYSHEAYGEKFYKTSIAAARTSGVYDYVPILVSERIVDIKKDVRGMFVHIIGSFRSFNRRDGHGRHCILSVFVQEWNELEYDEEQNDILLDGFICRNDGLRITPLGREIADFLITVNRQYGKSDYIPCITWGRNAKFADSLEVGSHVKVKGRIQSREYEKTIDGETETRTAYEVSVTTIEVIEGEEKEGKRNDG